MIPLLLACTAPVGPLSVDISSGPGLRDLVANISGPAELRWYEDDQQTDFTSRVVPADAVWPGSTWRVEVEQADGRRGDASYTVPEPDAGNVVVLVMDDVGVDKMSAYGGPWAAKTPTLDELAATGMRFTRAYASSVCSPTRGSLLTGLNPRRTGLGWVVDTGGRQGQLPLSAHTVPEVLRGTRGPPMQSAALGKWHVAGPNADDWLTHPNQQGFPHYAGAPGNPDYAADRGYFNWTKNVNGQTEQSTVYMTTDTADDVIEQLATLPEPFFLYVGFNAPHGPLHIPPAHLVTDPLDPSASRLERYDAMLEALDTEIGRIFDTLDPALLDHTTFITLGDNGTMARGIPPEHYSNRFKHTPYEGGIRVPFIVNGPYVTPGTVSDALIHVVDILPTVAEISGVPLAGPEGSHVVLDNGDWSAIDGRSLLPVFAGGSTRTHVYAEAFVRNGTPTPTEGQRAVRSATHKLIRWDDVEEFFRLDGLDELDDEPLTIGALSAPADRQAFDTLSAVMDELEVTNRYAP